MKKFICAFLSIGLAVSMIGCGDNKTVDNTISTVEETTAVQTTKAAVTETITEKSTPARIDRTMGVCGLYYYDETSNQRKFIEDVYDSKWVSGEDIVCFEVFNTTEKTIPGKIFKNIWEPIWFSTDEAKNYRIGYYVSFELNDGTKINQPLMEPEDTEVYKDYMEFYMYDDYHQTVGVWYSHVEQKAFNSDTILTSIKFTAGKKVSAIKGDITLTAFLFENGKMISKQDISKIIPQYTIKVRNKA